MITLHKLKKDAYSDNLEERLNNLVISYKAIEHHQKKEAKNLPHIEEDGKIFKTEEELEDWFSELEAELNWQRSLSGDGCFINPKDGKIC